MFQAHADEWWSLERQSLIFLKLMPQRVKLKAGNLLPWPKHGIGTRSLLLLTKPCKDAHSNSCCNVDIAIS